MPPKGGFKKKVTSDGTSTPITPSLAVQLSYLHQPRPFKNPAYTKNVNRRAKNLKTVLGQERDREKAEREVRRLRKEESMKDDPQVSAVIEEVPTYITIEAPPSVLPHIHLCDITGLQAPYTDPTTGLRYHDKNVYDIIKGLSTSTAKDYLSARGVNSIVNSGILSHFRSPRPQSLSRFYSIDRTIMITRDIINSLSIKWLRVL